MKYKPFQRERFLWREWIQNRINQGDTYQQAVNGFRLAQSLGLIVPIGIDWRGSTVYRLIEPKSKAKPNPNPCQQNNRL